MKKFLLLILFAALFIAANAQQTYQTFTTDTVKGDTVTFISAADVKYNGFVTWDYTVTGYSTGDTVYIDFKGSNDDWTTSQTLSTTTFIQGTTAANQHLVDNPAEFINYGLTMRAYEATDSARFTNVLYIYKR